MANDEENPDAQEGAEDKTSDDSNDIDDLSQQELAEKVQELEQKNKTLNEQRKHKDKKLQELQEALEDDNNSDQDDSTNDSDDNEQDLDMDQFYDMAQKVSDLSEDEYKEVSSKAQELGVSKKKFLESDAGQKYLQSYRQEKEVEESTPDPSNRGIVVNDKSWEEMSEEERRANFQDVVQGGSN